jgi:hypothetical protein
VYPFAAAFPCAPAEFGGLLRTTEDENIYQVKFLSAEAACVPFEAEDTQGTIIAVPGGACDIKEKLMNAAAAGPCQIMNHRLSNFHAFAGAVGFLLLSFSDPAPSLKIEGHSGRFLQQADWRDNLTIPVVAMAESFAQSLLGASGAGETIKIAIIGSAPEWRQCALRLELHANAKRTSFALEVFWKCVRALDDDAMIHFAADAGPTMEGIGGLTEVSTRVVAASAHLLPCRLHSFTSSHCPN